MRPNQLKCSVQLFNPPGQRCSGQKICSADIFLGLKTNFRRPQQISIGYNVLTKHQCDWLEHLLFGSTSRILSSTSGIRESPGLVGSFESKIPRVGDVTTWN